MGDVDIGRGVGDVDVDRVDGGMDVSRKVIPTGNYYGFVRGKHPCK